MMKRIITTIFSFVTACVMYGQAVATFDVNEYDYGIIPYNKPAEADIRITNTGNKPLIINDVYTSCGCTVAEWDSSSIKPGESSIIKVVYDAKMMGHFFKEISVYCNSEPYLYTISLVGEVSNTKMDYTKTHQFKMGDLLLNTDEILFDDVEMGKTYTKKISIVNMGDEPYTPILMLLPSYLSVKAEPEVLKHRQQGTLTVTLDGSKLKDIGLTQTSVYLSRYLGDKICDETNISVSAFVIPNVSDIPEDELLNAPQFFISATNWEPEMTHRKKKYSKTFEISNTGKRPLSIERLQVSNRALSVSLKSKTIKPGEDTKLKVTVNTKHVKRHRTFRVYIITNDPKHPKEVITIKV